MSTLSNNLQYGLLSNGTVDVADTTISGNGTSQSFGGVSVSAGATITSSSITGNDGIGLVTLGGTTSVTRSTVDHNQSTWSCSNAGCVGLGGGPGGIIALSGTLRLIDSTVSDNTVVSPFDGSITTGSLQVGFATCGAGCEFDQADAQIFSSTISERAFIALGTVTVSGSAMGSCQVSGIGGLPDAAKFVDGGGNVVVGTSCTFPSQLSVPDLQLGALANNGGPTRTRLPLAGSPVLDHIPAGTVGLCDGSVPTDQRGVTRPLGPACDAGSVEGHS